MLMIQCVTKSHKALVALSLRLNMSPSRHNVSGICDGTVERYDRDAGLFGNLMPQSNIGVCQLLM